MTLDSNCELCSLIELEQQLAADLGRLCPQIDALDTSPGQLIVSTTPIPARLRIDGREVGRTPWAGELTSGDHHIELRARGHRPQRHDVAVPPNIDLRRHYSLVSNWERLGRPVWPAWTSIGLGLALSVAGTALIAIHEQPFDGRCSGNDVDALGHCRYVLRTRPLGIGLAALGAGAMAGGVGLMFWAQRGPSQTCAGIQIGGQF